MMKKKRQTTCESCVHFEYDEEYEEYGCMINLDEDDMVRFVESSTFCCPYYQYDDEYKVVRHQM